MSGTYTRMILIQDMGCFINVELKTPKKGEAVLWY